MQLDRNIEEVLEEYMMGYSAYTILLRALADVRDGLKPSYRRIIYAMALEKATNLTKSANVTGAVMKLHPHGDTYPTIVGMVQKDSHQVPLIDGKGSFGQHTSRDLQAASSRYSEIKLSDLANDILKDLDKNIVDFEPSYDGKVMVPEVLPVKHPMILTQAQSGVAVGMGSSIPSFNMKELCEAVALYIKEGTTTILVPDFPTKGCILNDLATFEAVNKEGKGSIRIRGNAIVTDRTITITEIPYSTTREAIIDKVVDLVKQGKFKEIADIKDITGFKGMGMEIKCRRGADTNLTIQKLYALTPLESSFSVNMNVLVNKQPKVLGVWGIIDEWIEWRRECIVRGLENDIVKLKEKVHFLRGLEKVLLNIDEAINIIRFSKSSEVSSKIMKKFELDANQASEVINIKLRNLNAQEIKKKTKEIESMEKQIKKHEKTIKTPADLNDIIVAGLYEVSNKYGIDRQTNIIEMNNIKTIEPKVISNHQVMLLVSKEGYIKKLKQEQTDNEKWKPGDECLYGIMTKNDAELLIFGRDQCCHKIKVHELEDFKPSSIGQYIKGLCDVDEIVGVSILDDKAKFILVAYDTNKIAKVDLNSFRGNRKKLLKSLSNGEVKGILTFYGESKYILKTDRFEVECETKNLAIKATRNTIGVTPTSRKGDIISISHNGK